MLTNSMEDILTSFISKAVQNERHFEIDANTFNIIYSNGEDRFQVKSLVRYQVTHETDESSGIEWRYQSMELDFSSKGLFGGFNDDHYDSIFELVQEKVVDQQLLKRAQAALHTDKNEEIVLK